MMVIVPVKNDCLDRGVTPRNSMFLQWKFAEKPSMAIGDLDFRGIIKG